MKFYHPKTSALSKGPVLDRIERIHPFKMINYLIISVSCILFAVVSFFFIRFLAVDLKGDFSFAAPKFFIISAIILIVSTHFTSRMVRAYEADAISDLRRLISFTMISGLVFFLSQSLGWMEILKLELIHETEGISNYLFLISGFHVIYVIAGVVMSAVLFYKYMLIENDPVKTLITTTNPNEKVRLEIFRTFWNFTVYSWGLMFVLFLFIF